jgi:hypothetical protein
LTTPIEEIDRQLVESLLNLPVSINDDQTQDSMYDLRVGPRDNADLAIECVRATDPQIRAVFGTLKKKGPLIGNFSSHWIIELGRTTNVKNLYRKLPILLAEMELHGLDSTRNVNNLLPRHDFLFDELENLGVRSAYVSLMRPAKVVFLPPGSGGAVDELGTCIAPWIMEFLRSPTTADVISKLRKANAKRREVLIRADEYGVPWLVTSYLTDDLVHLPSETPRLPDQIDGVWLIYGSRGIRFDGELWSFVGA